MSATRSRRRSRSRPQDVLQKPAGIIHPRVQKVGPEHFGIVCIDCAKRRSKWMLADFFGKVLVLPTVVEHNRRPNRYRRRTRRCSVVPPAERDRPNHDWRSDNGLSQLFDRVERVQYDRYGSG